MNNEIQHTATKLKGQLVERTNYISITNDDPCCFYCVNKKLGGDEEFICAGELNSGQRIKIEISPYWICPNYKQIEKGELDVMKKYGCLSIMFDIFMMIITGGLWLVWLLIKFLRRNS